jgi:hypothetical protein
MSEFVELEQFLLTDPRDVGCDETLAALHVCVEVVAAGEDAAALYPDIAAHLAACGPCADVLAGLLAAVTGKQPGWR